MSFLGWELTYEDDETLGYKSQEDVSLWFYHSPNQTLQNYDAKGLNHIALKVSSQNEIDEIVEYLKSHNIETLWDTPRHREEFATDKDHTYYQVMFESKDKIQFEIVYIGVK